MGECERERENGRERSANGGRGVRKGDGEENELSRASKWERMEKIPAIESVK